MRLDNKLTKSFLIYCYCVLSLLVSIANLPSAGYSSLSHEDNGNGTLEIFSCVLVTKALISRSKISLGVKFSI